MNFAATRRNWPPMRSKKSLPVEQVSLLWDSPGLIAGVDEAGRGPLAGPVVAAAVILDELKPIRGLADSKKLSPRRREALFDEIMAKALCCSIAEASVAEIDRLNILQATFLAMQRAVAALPVVPAQVWVDGNQRPRGITLPVQTFVKGDQLHACISAASILAKVTRDRQMQVLDQAFPQYGFARHKGYPTAAHLAALAAHGILEEHRRSYAPVKKYL